jgi:hypothetical protein
MKVGVEPQQNAIHAVEMEFDDEERKQRENSARRIQGIARTRKAKQETDKRRQLRKQRSEKHKELPAVDAHGHANPATIRVFNRHPIVHAHHHGIFNYC